MSLSHDLISGAPLWEHQLPRGDMKIGGCGFVASTRGGRTIRLCTSDLDENSIDGLHA